MADDWLGSIGSALTSAGKGAAAGSILGPIGAAAGGAIGLALDLVPGLAKEVGRNADVAAQVVQTVQAVTGTADPAQQHTALADPSVATDLKVQLAGILADQEAARDQARLDTLKAQFADVANARAQSLLLTQAGSKMAFGSAIVSAVLLVAWFSSLIANYFHLQPLSADDAAVLRNLALLVAGYWIGSSAGSATKDNRLAGSVPASMLPQPAAVVPAADVPK